MISINIWLLWYHSFYVYVLAGFPFPSGFYHLYVFGTTGPSVVDDFLGIVGKKCKKIAQPSARFSNYDFGPKLKNLNCVFSTLHDFLVCFCTALIEMMSYSSCSDMFRWLKIQTISIESILSKLATLYCRRRWSSSSIFISKRIQHKCLLLGSQVLMRMKCQVLG